MSVAAFAPLLGGIAETVGYLVLGSFLAVVLVVVATAAWFEWRHERRSRRARRALRQRLTTREQHYTSCDARAFGAWDADDDLGAE